MGEKEDLLAEVDRLIREQMEALKGSITPEQAIEYHLRYNRIQELLDHLSQDGFKGE